MEKVLALLLCLGLCGCATMGLSKDDYYNRLGKIELGISKSDFKKIFPESVPRGAREYPKGSIEVLEVSYQYYSFFPTGNRNRDELSGIEGQPQWFYFYNGKLIQYGNPEDWPTNPDLIIEHRIR